MSMVKVVDLLIQTQITKKQPTINLVEELELGLNGSFKYKVLKKVKKGTLIVPFFLFEKE